jgi:lactate dehydrogenase-like 2-hydroxyacid dehydrogenase
MNQPILVHSWVSDEVLADLKSRFEVDHVDVLASGALPPEEFARRAEGMAGLMISAAKVPANLLSTCAGTLKVVANVAVGFDNIDVDAATAAGVQVTNTPDVLTDAVAEMTIGLVIAVGRHLIEADRYTRAGKFKANSFVGRPAGRRDARHHRPRPHRQSRGAAAARLRHESDLQRHPRLRRRARARARGREAQP